MGSCLLTASPTAVLHIIETERWTPAQFGELSIDLSTQIFLVYPGESEEASSPQFPPKALLSLASPRDCQEPSHMLTISRSDGGLRQALQSRWSQE